MNRLSSTPLDRVRRINGELAGLFGCEPAPLRTGSELRRRDALVVCGLLGGKDVGKSTLINAIAQEVVSVDRLEVGEGTARPMAYLHAEAVEAFQRRFADGAGRDRPLDCDVTTHHIDAIRDLVLVDLPDIDSTFHEHLETVKAAVDGLDRVVWVFDPKKGDDRAVADLLPRIVRDHANVYSVLNKLDETLSDGFDGDGADGFWRSQSAWFQGCLESVGLAPGANRRFLFSARFTGPDAFTGAVARHWGDPDWSQFRRDFPLVRAVAEQATAELERFRGEILRPLTHEEIGRLKQGNRSAELQANIDDLIRHYDLPGTVDRAGAALNSLDTEYAREFDAEYVATVARRLARSGRGDIELGQTLMGRRVERWPVLPVLYWPLRGLVRWLGSRFGPPGSASVARSPEDLLRVRGRGLEQRTDSLQCRLRRRLLSLPAALAPADHWPAPTTQANRAGGGVIEQAEQLREAMVARCLAGDAAPGALRRFLLWLILFWFPLLQPLARGVLELAAERNLSGGLHAALTIVTALGAGALLKGLAASGLVYLVILGVMFARAVRDVRRECRASDAGSAESSLYVVAVEEILTGEIHTPLRRPVEDLVDRLRRYHDELEQLRRSVS